MKQGAAAIECDHGYDGCPICDSDDAVDPRILTFRQFTEANRRRCEHPQGFNHSLSSWTASDWMVALMGEAGEACNVVKKLNRLRDGIPGNKEAGAELRGKLEMELADAFIYLDLTCQALGIDLASAVLRAFNNKSGEIGYPEKL